MKIKHNKRAVVLLVCLILVLTASVGSTLAYLLSTTEPLTNEFEPAEVGCEVQDDYSIQNTGNVDAYIRVSIVATWTKSDGTVSAQQPEYSFILGSNWTKAADGYYYYSAPVAPDGKTDALLSDLSSGNIPGYSFELQIVASAVQADPVSVVTDVWSSGVSGVTGINGDQLTIKLETTD